MSMETKHTPDFSALVSDQQRDEANKIIDMIVEEVRPFDDMTELACAYVLLKANADALRNFVEYYLDRDCSVEDCDKVARALLAKLDWRFG